MSFMGRLMDYKVRDKISKMSTLILLPTACKKAVLSIVLTPQQFAKRLSKSSTLF